jgi:hypothetical protein
MYAKMFQPNAFQNEPKSAFWVWIYASGNPDAHSRWQLVWPGANPMIVSYYSSAVKNLQRHD